MRLPWSQIDLRWTPHVPGLAANPTTCAAAGRHRRSRTCEVHARYEAGTSPEAMSAVRQLEPGHAEQLSKTAASPHGCPGPSNPADERSGQPRQLCPPGKCRGLPDRYPSHQRNAFPAAHAPGKHGAARRTHGDARPTRQRASSRNTPPAPPVRPSVAVRGKPAVTPTVPAARTPSAMRPWMPQHSAQQRDKVTHHAIEKKRPANARIRSERAVFPGCGRCWVRTNVG
jgi:hypothetical protein